MRDHLRMAKVDAEEEIYENLRDPEKNHGLNF
jgi:hypothetical protein